MDEKLASMMWMRATAVLVAVGCSSHHGTPGDAAGSGHVSFVTSCAPTSSIAFAPTPPGETAMAAVFAVNDSDDDVVFDSHDIKQITGADAADFAMTGAGMYCSFPVYFSLLAPFNCCPGQVLAPHAWCQLTFEFHPTAMGSKQASYAVGDAGVLSLAGSSVAPPARFHADRINIAQGYIPTAAENHATTDTRPFTSPISFKLINDSPATVDVGTLVVDPLFTATDDCPASLTPGGACNAQVSIAPDPRGGPPRIAECRATTLTSSSSTLSVPVTYSPPPAPMPTSFGVTIIGDGGGSVTSPAGIDCVAGDSSSACSATSWAPASVELTAAPAADAELVGWFATTGALSPCGKAASCLLPVPMPSLFERTASGIWAWFAPATDKHVNVTIVGTGTVRLGGNGVDRSWSFAVPPGSAAALDAVTAGTFVGWSGDCSGTGQCQLGTVINDRNVTATFSP